MKLARYSIENRVVTLTATVVMLVGGLYSFGGLSRLEDPEFTIKDALIITPYPGASAQEVEEEVTDEIEKAVQALAQLKEIESKSERGRSTLTVTIQDKYDRERLPQVWDELRRKVNDAQNLLPPGAGPSIVVDDFGDVYGIFVAVYGDEYTYAELKRFVDLLRRELLLVEDVAKIDTFGERVEAIHVDLNRDRMSQLGIPPTQIVEQLRAKNVAAHAGRVEVGPEFITIVPSGLTNTVRDVESILINPNSANKVYLRDVATIERGYVEPRTTMLRYDGKDAIGLGISTVSGGNVVTMGEALERRIRELAPLTPLGIEVGAVSIQSQAVTVAIDGFVVSLVQAVAIVIVVLLFFMGLRSGLLIGFVLVLTISGTFIFMGPMGVALERISLGALIIALGMLVDNAIVVVDGVLIRLQKGEDAADAANVVVEQSAIPLLGATVIAILAFAAIGTSDDSTGEFCRSLFQVVLVSLGLSWVTAVTVTPLLCVMFLKSPGGDTGADPYDRSLYRAYRNLLRTCIRVRWLTVGVVFALFLLAMRGFGYIDQTFFPPSTRPQFMIDFWLPQGTHIDTTAEKVDAISEYVLGLEGTTHVSSLIGQGALRFLLTYSPEKANSGYAQLLVDVDAAERVDALIPEIQTYLEENHPDALSFASKFELGPGSNGKIRARFSGPNDAVLRGLADRAAASLHATGNAKGVRTDWGQRVKVIEPVLIEDAADLNGLTRPDVARTLLEAFQGVQVGVFRERDLLLPIIMRAEAEQRSDVASIQNIQIWSPAAQAMIPLRQVVSEFRTTSENEIIMRRDRRPTITVFADPRSGSATRLFERVRPEIEAIPLPTDYGLEWGGEYEDTNNARGPLLASLPIFILFMLLVTIGLFNSLKQSLIIWLCVPLATIGVTLGLLLTNQPFGFMALLGFLSLMGMLIKNAIVLIDEINLQSSTGKALMPAILDSGTSRLRPVAMAASTTALGMIPLLADAFFVSMAVTIIFGLIFATLLTMVIVPVLYAIFFGAAETEGA